MSNIFELFLVGCCKMIVLKTVLEIDFLQKIPRMLGVVENFCKKVDIKSKSP
jgi:hypothetical protein